MGKIGCIFLVIVISLHDSAASGKTKSCTFNMLNTTDSNTEVQAMLLPCTEDQQAGKCSNETANVTDDRLPEMFQLTGFNRTDPIFQSDLVKCVNKLEVVIKINNIGKTNLVEEFILINEVLDPNTCVLMPLLSPYAVKIQNLQVMELYNMVYSQMVNGEATEVVIDSHDKNFTGCNEGYDHPTCGLDYSNGLPVRYSQGFCCNCDETTTTPACTAEATAEALGDQPLPNLTEEPNLAEELSLSNLTEVSLSNLTVGQPLANLTVVPLGDSLHGRTAAERFVDARIRLAAARRRVHPKRLATPQPLPAHAPAGVFRKPHHRLFPPGANCTGGDCAPRSAKADTGQAPRHGGGESKSGSRRRRDAEQQGPSRDCAGFDPGSSDPNARSSAHCLRFADTWYGVYELQKPILEQEVTVQAFGRKELDDGTWHWQEITPGRPFRLGTRKHVAHDEPAGVAVRYAELQCAEAEDGFSLDANTTLLLMPQPSRRERAAQPQGVPAEFLVVDRELVSVDGSRCDTAGVGYRAFSKQPGRCAVPAGSCLRNQPLHMWRRDTEARLRGRRGAFFLENWGQPAEPPLVVRDGKLYLALAYPGRYPSLLRLQLRADLNSPLQFGNAARVTEVRIDATQHDATRITALVTNLGVAATRLRLRMRPCGGWYATQSDQASLQARQSVSLELQLPGQPDRDRLRCTLEVVTRHDEVVTERAVRVQRRDRCACAWQCRCVCVLTRDAAEDLNGEVCGPAVVEPAPPSLLVTILRRLPLCLLWLLLLLLLLGLLKALLGLCWPVAAAWGQDGLSDSPPQLVRYREKELSHVRVVHDAEGYPVHPHTYRRTVQIHSKPREFLLNLVLFVAWPAAYCWRTCCRGPPDDACECATWAHTITIGEATRRGVLARAEIEEDDGIYHGDCREEADVLFVRRGLQNSAESLMEQPAWHTCFCPDDVYPQPGEHAPLMGNYDDDDGADDSVPLLYEFEEVAERMVRAPCVYRTLCTPKGGLDFPDGVRYSIRGRLCHFGVMGYQFKPDTPLVQTWGWSGGELVRLYSARPLRAVDLQREYFNASDVACGDITEEPVGPVLNSESVHD